MGDDLRYAYCCVASNEGPLVSITYFHLIVLSSTNGPIRQVCSRVLSSTGGRYITIAGELCPLRADITSIMSRGQSLVAYEFKGNKGTTKQTSEQRKLGAKVFDMSLKYINEGKIQLPSVELRQGLEGALQGIDDLRLNKISGKKIVSQLV